MKYFSCFAIIFFIHFAYLEADFISTTIDDTFYLIWHDSKLPWKDALKFCEDKNMKLLSLQNAEKNQKLNEYLSEQGFVDDPSPGAKFIYWTSGNDLKQEGEFVWESTGEKFTYTNWLPRMPDNWRNDENCVELGYQELGKWNDSRCCYSRSFICERQVNRNNGE